MDKYYYDLNKSSAFTSASEVARVSKRPRKRVEKWLERQDTWARHKPVRYKFKQRRTTGTAVFTHIQADLADLTPLAHSNGGNRWMLILVDCYSRFCMARPVHRKTGKDVAEALDSCFKEAGMHPTVLITDRGLEFVNSHVKDVLAPGELVHPHSERKSSMAERMVRTIKTRMYKYFTFSKKKNWAAVLPQIVAGINNSYHRVLKTTPQKVFDGEEEPASIDEPKSRAEIKFQPGDRVRLSLFKQVFRKGYTSQWSNNIYTIVRRLETNPPTFHVINEKGERVKGIIYAPEMIKVF